MFYSALHLVTDYLVRQKIDKPATHGEMRRLLQSQLPEIMTPYAALLKLSWNAQYAGYDSVKDQKDIAIKYYEQIKRRLPQS